MRERRKKGHNPAHRGAEKGAEEAICLRGLHRFPHLDIDRTTPPGEVVRWGIFLGPGAQKNCQLRLVGSKKSIFLCTGYFLDFFTFVRAHHGTTGWSGPPGARTSLGRTPPAWCGPWGAVRVGQTVFGGWAVASGVGLRTSLCEGRLWI